MISLNVEDKMTDTVDNADCCYCSSNDGQYIDC